MSSTFYQLFDPLRRPLTQRQSVLLVLLCTFLGAAAQVFMKIGAGQLPATTELLSHPVLLLINWPLWAGLSLYGAFTVLLIVALRDGELSILYPVIALNYVWVTLLSIILFRETMNPWKILGISTIVAGVVILGRGTKR